LAFISRVSGNEIFDVVCRYTFCVPIKLRANTVSNVMVCPKRRPLLIWFGVLPSPRPTQVKCKNSKPIKVRGMSKIQSLKNQLIYKYKVYPVANLIIQEEIERYVVGALQVSHPLAKEVSRYIS
jgi:hypothetical protein